ncbi:MAG TPA: S24 family peptidase [Candidatus Dormibacteraeota bacterium]|nr:S24 family peptidase [Candidatus Dormibacteraeota bacterium]
MKTTQDSSQATPDSSDGVSIHSGFPNPGLDRLGQGPQLALDLNKLLIKHPSSTYVFRITGHDWADQGIYDGDVVIVDRAVGSRTTDLIVAWHDNVLVIGKYHKLSLSAKPWGVVTAIIHQYRT